MDRYRAWIVLFLRVGFGVLLIVASMDKIRQPFGFAGMVENYRVVGEGLSLWVAVWLPVLEFFTGLFLILGLWSEAVVLINFLLMAVFFILVIQAYVRHLDIQCGCFSTEEGGRIGILKVIENFIFMAGSILLAWMAFNNRRIIFNKTG